MPKFGVHSIIMQEARDSSTEEIRAIMDAHPGAALLGSIGPDFLFFSPEYGPFNFFTQLGHNFKAVKNAYGDVKESIKAALQPIVDALAEATPIDESIEIIGDLLPLNCMNSVADDVKGASDAFRSAMRNTLLVGMNEGVDMIADAADLPTVSHRVFDGLFTPAHQNGKREWDWYWFDMLHYRNAGLFGKNLIKFAETDFEKAYALGYLTHIAADTIGHAYVNRIVGGPYRNHPQRHVIVENFIDSWKYFKHTGESINKHLNRDLLDAMAADDVCTVDEYSGYVEEFSSELKVLLDRAFRATFPEDPTTATDDHPPRPGWLSQADIETTFENFHVTMSLLAESYVDEPDLSYDEVADYLNDLLSNFEPPPAPPDIGNTELCFSLECIKNFFEQIEEWMEWFKELAEWTFETIKNALDLLIELFCEATVGMARGIFYLVERLCYELYQHMHFMLSLCGYFCPEPTHAVEDPRGEALVRTGPYIQELTDCPVVVPGCYSVYPYRHDCLVNAAQFPLTETELPATWFPRFNTDDFPDWYIEDAPCANLPETVQNYALSPSPAVTRALANPADGEGMDMGNAVDFARWMMEQALVIKADEALTGDKSPQSDIVHCNWDLDSDRGYAYKQWCTNNRPSDHVDLDPEFYLDEDLSRDRM